MICPVCTYHNNLSQIQCLICQASLLSEKKEGSDSQASREDGVECRHCTFRNLKGAKYCEACSGLLKRKRAASSDDPQVIYDRSLIIPLSFLSYFLLVVEEEDQKERQPAQMHASVTHGIIPLIREVLEEELEDNPRSSNNFHLCSTACPHVSQKGVPMGGEWSCGYRNIQMLCHTLMALPSYRKALFNGTGEVPDVHGLQAWIDKAWDAGFDVEVNIYALP
jgi:hypothetical protein